MAKIIAFALAGLGGFNAHGAGFLMAARAKGVVPDIVTATSGQILVLSEWLEGGDLLATLVKPALEKNPLAQMSVGLLGYPNVFRPAYSEALTRLWKLPLSLKDPVKAISDRLLPAQQYVPVRDKATFEAVAKVLNAGMTKDGQGRSAWCSTPMTSRQGRRSFTATTRPEVCGPPRAPFPTSPPRSIRATRRAATRKRR